MNWGSAAEFFAMGGDAFFVWGSYAVCLACMLVEPVLAARRRSRALQAARHEAGQGSPDGRDQDDEEDLRS